MTRPPFERGDRVYHSWVTYSVAVYVGLLLAGALVDPRQGGGHDQIDAPATFVEYRPPVMAAPLPSHQAEELSAARS